MQNRLFSYYNYIIMQYFIELGQNPELSLAELVAVYPKIKILRQIDKAVIFELDEKPDIERLGGTPKLGEALGEGKPKKIILENLLKNSKDKKIFFGLSFYGKWDKNLGREIKQYLTDEGYKVRWVTGKEPVLSSVIVRTNKLLTRGGEFCVFFSSSPSARGRKEEGVWVAKTYAAQNFSDYEFRDMRRPARDLISGMTPPKLAKIMINLGLADFPLRRRGNKGDLIIRDFLDPFCGSGTLLMEASLLGIKNIYGSDISEKAIRDSEANLAWLFEKYKLLEARLPIVKKCDVKNLQECWGKKFKLIVGEPYLGPAIRGALSLQKAEELKKELEKNYDEYLAGLSDALEKGGRLVLVVPVLLSARQSVRISARIQKYGLKAVREPILYSRPDQKIGREIYILEKM